MDSVTQSFFKLFRNDVVPPQARPAQPPAARIGRHSSGLKEFTRSIAGREDLCILDLGSTSATNIALFTGQGYKVCTEDVLQAAYEPSLVVKNEEGKSTVDVTRFLADNLAYRGRIFDAALCWDVADYLPEPLVKPVVERICAMMKPGGVLLAYFHTRDAGPDAPHYRYHIAGQDLLSLQPTATKNGSPRYRLQRVFNNRHIENLFKEFASLKFFLARDNVREVLVVR
jgi:SAM-dependent methyltransferase